MKPAPFFPMLLLVMLAAGISLYPVTAAPEADPATPASKETEAVPTASGLPSAEESPGSKAPPPVPTPDAPLLEEDAVRPTRPPEANSGGATTVFNDGKEAFALPLANISREARREFATGNSFFNNNWVIAPASAAARDGLGPFFNSRSCSACHVKDGRGRPPEEGEVMTGLLLRLSVPGTDAHGGPKPDPIYGGQLGVRVIEHPAGLKPEADVPVKWVESVHTFPDGETTALRRPEFGPIVWHYGEPSKDLMLGPRLAQPSYGGGLLEAVPEAVIRALADPDDANHDGISGRVNEVHDFDLGRKSLGRFGWKANQPSLRQQAADAFLNDIGLTSELHPEEAVTPAQATVLGPMPTGNDPDGGPEVSGKIFTRVVTYLRALAVPGRRQLDDPVVRKGEQLFTQANCTACHIPELKTGGDAELTELRNQTIRPYTDLLLHDMGSGLADGRPDFEATGSEWRTQPLWGIGLNKEVNGNEFFLHDGRARTLQEAILWHDGEAKASRTAFENMSREDRTALLRFLSSL
ncbi:MAG: thiol oxidoreductase [Verrucomicrobiales bacterium]|nr:thiol oxidoreductase [Verrucomicrobiales bacterium]